jgi:hypothetical protein
MILIVIICTYPTCILVLYHHKGACQPRKNYAFIRCMKYLIQQYIWGGVDERVRALASIGSRRFVHDDDCESPITAGHSLGVPSIKNSIGADRPSKLRSPSSCSPKHGWCRSKAISSTVSARELWLQLPGIGVGTDFGRIRGVSDNGRPNCQHDPIERV